MTGRVSAEVRSIEEGDSPAMTLKYGGTDGEQQERRRLHVRVVLMAVESR
jgi:hypothetical protein